MAWTGYSSVIDSTSTRNDVDLARNERSAGLGVVPSVVVLNDWVSPNPKPQALSNLADRVLLGTPGRPPGVPVEGRRCARRRRDVPAGSVVRGSRSERRAASGGARLRPATIADVDVGEPPVPALAHRMKQSAGVIIQEPGLPCVDVRTEQPLRRLRAHVLEGPGGRRRVDAAGGSEAHEEPWSHDADHRLPR